MRLDRAPTRASPARLRLQGHLHSPPRAGHLPLEGGLGFPAQPSRDLGQMAALPSRIWGSLDPTPSGGAVSYGAAISRAIITQRRRDQARARPATLPPWVWLHPSSQGDGAGETLCYGDRK